MEWKASVDRVIVSQPKVKDRKTPGGIVLPDKLKGNRTGTVLAAGPDAKNVQPGDTVFFAETYAKIVDETDAATIFSMNADSVLAIQRD